MSNSRKGAWAVQYELGASVDCYRGLLRAEGNFDAIGQNAYLEAMLVHARCVIEFIAKPPEKGQPRDTGLSIVMTTSTDGKSATPRRLSSETRV